MAMHVIRGASADITTDWVQLPEGFYTLGGSGTLGGGTLKLQVGMRNGDGTFATLVDDADLAVDVAAAGKIIRVTRDAWYRGVLTGSTGADGVNLWVA